MSESNGVPFLTQAMCIGAELDSIPVANNAEYVDHFERLVSTALAAAHAKGRAEGIGEAVAYHDTMATRARERLVRATDEGREVRHAYREMREAEQAASDIRALLPTTGGSE